MPKNKRPAPRKSADAPEAKDEQQVRMLCQLALNLSEREDGEALGEVLREQEADFHKMVRKALNQQKDEVLYGAVEQARYEDVGAYQYLRGAIEESAATVLLRREGAPELEINAFAIPLFAHTAGGLDAAQDFQDQDAFDALLASFTDAGLEGPKAKVVLLRHAYDLDEIDRITYGQLHAMVREAAQTMTEKKLAPTPALEASLQGWSPAGFGPDDTAVELRFLLGFALKRSDDPFYAVPRDESAADAYFAQRMERYQRWTEEYAPLVARCLGPDRAGALPQINFLYQDLFFGAKEQGLAEYATLRMLSRLNQALQDHGGAPGQAAALIAPAEVDHELVLRVQLYAEAGGALLATCDKPLDLAADLEGELDDLRDALDGIGVRQVSVALKFDAQGNPVAPRAPA